MRRWSSARRQWGSMWGGIGEQGGEEFTTEAQRGRRLHRGKMELGVTHLNLGTQTSVSCCLPI
jgi:hypothetical protein